MRTLMLLALALLAASAPVAAEDLAAIKAEGNPEKRSDKALDNAALSLKAAEEAYSKGQSADAGLEAVQESVELSYNSLRETGKNPSKSPKYFKRAEIKTRELLRRLEDFRNEMGAEDRAKIDKVRESVHRVHEDLLLGIMGSKDSRLRTKR